jgi:bacillithiol biosynthesis deacetylase BshB1
MLDALIIAPHPDDAEIGMGGTLKKMQQDGLAVGVLDLTSGEPTPFGSAEIRIQETADATETLAIEWRENLGLTNRKLQPTLEARAQLANVFRRVRPRWLFAPYPVDAHPDHTAATQLVEEARFWSKLTKSELDGEPFHPERVFFYYSIHLRAIVDPDFVVDISEFWQAKIDSLRCYQSQFITGREALNPSVLDRVETHNAYFGHLIAKQYGEPFSCREPIGLASLASLL